MSVRLFMAGLVFLMVHAVLFGAGALGVLASPLQEQAMLLLPIVIATSAMIAALISWRIAVYLRTHNRGRRLAG